MTPKNVRKIDCKAVRVDPTRGTVVFSLCRFRRVLPTVLTATAATFAAYVFTGVWMN